MVENQKNFIVSWKKSFRGGISWSTLVTSVFVRKWLAILFNNYNSGMKLTTIHKYIIKIFIVNIIIILVTRHESSFARIVSITITMSVEFYIMYLLQYTINHTVKMYNFLSFWMFTVGHKLIAIITHPPSPVTINRVWYVGIVSDEL